MSTEFRRLNPKEKLLKSAVKEFGTTYDCREAGYILEDGSMLDFSGKREGGTPRTRNYDHREINRAIDTGDKGIGGDAAMEFFQKEAGAIRFGMVGGSTEGRRGYEMNVQVDTFAEPTQKQWDKMHRCCVMFRPDIAYDVYDSSGRRVSSDLLSKPSCRRGVDAVRKTLEKAKQEEREKR